MALSYSTFPDIGDNHVLCSRYADKPAQRTNNSSPAMASLMETLKREALVEDWGVAYEGKFIGGFAR